MGGVQRWEGKAVSVSSLPSVPSALAQASGGGRGRRAKYHVIAPLFCEICFGTH